MDRAVTSRRWAMAAAVTGRLAIRRIWMISNSLSALRMITPSQLTQPWQLAFTISQQNSIEKPAGGFPGQGYSHDLPRGFVDLLHHPRRHHHRDRHGHDLRTGHCADWGQARRVRRHLRL